MNRTSPLMSLLALAGLLASGESRASDPPAEFCMERGQLHGASVNQGGAFTMGILSGLTLGLVGTGITWAAQGAPTPSTPSGEMFEDPGCLAAYNEAFALEGRRRKRRAVLQGATIGIFLGTVAAYSLLDEGDKHIALVVPLVGFAPFLAGAAYAIGND